MKWNIVGHCLPAAMKKVIAFYRNSHGNGRRVMAVYIPPITVDVANFYPEYVDDYTFDKLEYEDTEYVKTGWFESIENHDECGYFPIDGTVTHWAFLPEEPEDS